jgi:isopentenyl-diphosphate Delta-isomerase
MEERVVLVDENDAEVGTLEKQRAHAEGRLHRALSVFVLNSRGEMLLQRRAAAKYHSGGLWTNACCSHPRPGEPVDHAARRRLREEMGIDAPLEPAFVFVYRAAVGPGLEEHEYDHVFLARYDGDPDPSLDEVDGWRWVPVEQVAREVRDDPGAFTPWFRMVFARPDWAARLAAFQPVPG